MRGGRPSRWRMACRRTLRKNETFKMLWLSMLFWSSLLKCSSEGFTTKSTFAFVGVPVIGVQNEGLIKWPFQHLPTLWYSTFGCWKTVQSSFSKHLHKVPAQFQGIVDSKGQNSIYTLRKNGSTLEGAWVFSQSNQDTRRAGMQQTSGTIKARDLIQCGFCLHLFSSWGVSVAFSCYRSSIPMWWKTRLGTSSNIYS